MSAGGTWHERLKGLGEPPSGGSGRHEWRCMLEGSIVVKVPHEEHERDYRVDPYESVCVPAEDLRAMVVEMIRKGAFAPLTSDEQGMAQETPR